MIFVFDILNFPSGTTMVTVACDETCQPDETCNCFKVNDPMDECHGHICDSPDWMCTCGMTLNKTFKINQTFHGI